MILTACSKEAPPPTPGGGSTVRDDDASGSASGALTRLAEDARWQRLAVPIAVALDGRRWIGGVDHELVVFDGDREVSRLAVMVSGDDQLAPLPDGGWIAGARIVGSDGAIRFDGHQWGNRYGRFGSAKAMSVSPDGTVAIIAGADAPSTCLRDRECGNAGSWRGALARLSFAPAGDAAAPAQRLLIEHENRRDFHVAASDRWVAATEGSALSVWPATGDGPPITATLDGGAPRSLTWAGDRYLIATRMLDAERTEVVVLDGEAAYAPSAAWIVDGQIEALAVRPSGQELAIASSWYRARTHVEIDEKRIDIYALDGTRHARVDLPAIPMSLAWTPRGEALYASLSGNRPETLLVIRYLAR